MFTAVFFPVLTYKGLDTRATGFSRLHPDSYSCRGEWRKGVQAGIVSIGVCVCV
jgi:hypothetical protein